MVRVVSLFTTDVSTRRVSAGQFFRVFGVWLELVPLAQPASIQCSTPRRINPTLYLNRFRGEPAMSRFDWPFTPIHKSSESFSTDTGSDLQLVLPNLHPAHG
jgi:hypothetical protein